jgi:glycosyltransferase involved in cell wall biosynthesis
MSIRIGFDVSQTVPPAAGCGQMANSLIRGLTDLYPDDEFILYPVFGATYCDPLQAKEISRIQRPNVRYALEGLTSLEVYLFWRDPDRYSRDLLGSPDLIHANNFFCPRLTGTRVVYTLYDLSFIDHPEFTTPANRAVCQLGLESAQKHADMIVAISEHSKNRFLQEYPEFPVERVTVVHLGSRFHEPSPVKPVIGLDSDGFWLSVGTLEPRKNLRTLLKAYALHVKEVAAPSPLVLAGGKGWLEHELNREIRRLGLRPFVRVLGYVEDSELRWLYRNCRGFCYPSWYEGFGLPVLEAMSMSSAVITSNSSSLPEVAGDAALYVDPSDVQGIAAALTELDSSSQLRQDLRAKGAQRASLFTWKKAAATVRTIYEETLALPPRARGLFTVGRNVVDIQAVAQELKSTPPEMRVDIAGEARGTAAKAQIQYNTTMIRPRWSDVSLGELARISLYLFLKRRPRLKNWANRVLELGPRLTGWMKGTRTR